MSKKPRVTFSLTPVVKLEIRGEPRDHRHDGGGRPLPTCPDDGGAVGDFGVWKFEKKLYPLFSHASGGGIYVADFAEQDVSAIRQFLVEWGAVEVDCVEYREDPSDAKAAEIVSDSVVDEPYEVQRALLRRLTQHLVEAGEF